LYGVSHLDRQATHSLLRVHLDVSDSHPVGLVAPRRKLAVLRQARIVRHNAFAVLAARRNRLRSGLHLVLAQVVDDLPRTTPKRNVLKRRAGRNRRLHSQTQAVVRRIAELVKVLVTGPAHARRHNAVGDPQVLFDQRPLLVREPHVNLRLECPQKRPATRRIARPSHSRRT
jgi:hypothetical protein